MLESNVTGRIELLIKKDSKTEKIFTLSQCDYNISPNYYVEEEEPTVVEINLSGGINTGVDTLFLEWMSKQKGEWSGNLKIYSRDMEKPVVTIKFDKIVPMNYSQSFSEFSSGTNDIYFSSILRGVVLNDIKM
ncbi:type VI secretion system tube protein TssD [Formosa sp. PL04]|uniref:type VI secretion system tube protein TssD n=1 Tax=Formosa sp. PL04 TaxID=3081755 RepID=UPI002982367B|nr:type VI secretion system tube protein TssD [Formosa sp. PL04]MDW5290153.1 type VI secretion system tube protein TssD [Formosa sp. PL04]